MKTFFLVFFAIFASAIFAQDRKDDVVKAVAKVLPSVVNIGTERVVSTSYSPWGNNDPFESFFRDFFGEQIQRRTSSLGSGVIIDSTGLIITNAHVVHRATEINIVLWDGRSVKAMEIASDDLNDLALLSILPPVPKNLKPISIGRPGELYLGETVIAVGNPYGLGSSISKGILSAANREAVYQGRVIFSDILQTDAAINPGNSGGPLVNIFGEMIGVNTAIHREAHGIGFAVPVSRVEAVVCKWLIPERFSNTSLGIIPEADSSRDYFKIGEVIADSPADRAGLKAGTKIVSVNGQKYDNLISVGSKLWALKAGAKIILRDINGKDWNIMAEELRFTDGKQIAKSRLDLALVELDKSVASSLDYPFTGGLLVVQGPKDNPEIKRGEILVRLNDSRINSFEDLARAMKNCRYGQKILALFLSVIKRGGTVYIAKKQVAIEVK